MSEAKNTAVNSRALWSGPRAVFSQESLGADVVQVAALHDAASASGLDGVEWIVPQDAGTLVHSIQALAAALPGSADRRCAVTTQLRSTDLEKVIHDLNEALDLTGRLGATYLSLTLPPITNRTDPTSDAGTTVAFTSYQDHLNFVFQILHRLRFAAERSGVALAVEAATGGGLLSPVELREIVDEANSTSVGVCLDVARVAQVGSVADWILTLGHRLRAVRLGRKDRVSEAFDALARVGFDHTVTVVDVALGTAVREALWPPQ